MSFRIATDSGCDLNLDYCKKRNINIVQMKYDFGGDLIVDRMIESETKTFYSRLRNGETPHTGAVNPSEYIDFWESLFKNDCSPLLHICMGSGISSTFRNAKLALEMFNSDHPDNKVVVIDSLGASGSCGMLASIASDMRDQGKAIDEVVKWLEENRNKTNAFYTTGDLKWFYQGGRINKLAFTVAKAMNIWPLMTLSLDGSLIGFEKIRGKQADYARVKALVKERVINPQNQTLFLCHADNEIEARPMAEEIVKECGFRDYQLSFIGTTIGSHTGPGLLAVFFMGKERNDLK